MIASMKPLTKMTRQIVSAASIPTIVREAFRVAMEERPGPVHLELPEDIAGEEAGPCRSCRCTRSSGRSPTRPRSTGPPAMILAAKRPLIMIGAAGNRPRLRRTLSDFVRRTRIPFFNTQMGKGAVAGGPTSIWARRRCPSATTCTRRSTGPT